MVLIAYAQSRQRHSLLAQKIRVKDEGSGHILCLQPHQTAAYVCLKNDFTDMRCS